MFKKSVLLFTIFWSAFTFAEMDCKGATGLWLGKFSYKDLSLCELQSPELCEKVNIAIGLKYLPEEDQYLADLYPQRGIAGTIKLVCKNGALFPVDPDSKLPPASSISFQCDALDNCTAIYKDVRLEALLVKMWKEDSRV